MHLRVPRLTSLDGFADQSAFSRVSQLRQLASCVIVVRVAASAWFLNLHQERCAVCGAR